MKSSAVSIVLCIAIVYFGCNIQISRKAVYEATILYWGRDCFCRNSFTGLHRLRLHSRLCAIQHLLDSHKCSALCMKLRCTAASRSVFMAVMFPQFVLWTPELGSSSPTHVLLSILPSLIKIFFCFQGRYLLAVKKLKYLKGTVHTALLEGIAYWYRLLL